MTATGPQSQEADLTPEPSSDGAMVDSENIGSLAYCDAIRKLDDESKEMVLRGRNLDQLLKNLGERDAESAKNSLSRKGLKKVQKPLENVKLAVDLAQPLLDLAPVVATAADAVKSLTIVGVQAVCVRLIGPVSRKYARLPLVFAEIARPSLPKSPGCCSKPPL